jgi:hypothetical protein
MNAPDEFTVIGHAGNNRGNFRFSFDIQPQVSASFCGIGTMTLKAVLGQNRTHLPIEVNRGFGERYAPGAGAENGKQTGKQTGNNLLIKDEPGHGEVSHAVERLPTGRWVLNDGRWESSESRRTWFDSHLISLMGTLYCTVTQPFSKVVAQSV